MATDTAMSTSNPLPPATTPPPTTTTSKPTRLPPTTPSPPTPYTFDLGHLLLHDPNPLPPHPSTTDLSTRARTCAQALVNQLLTTCTITSDAVSGVQLALPPTTFPLPREKPLPAPKQKTKWEKFAAKKGIAAKAAGKMVYDEGKGEWVAKWGYRGRNKEGEGEWIVEVDEKVEREVEGRGDGSGVRGEGRRERAERVRRNERRERANERKGRKGGVGVGA